MTGHPSACPTFSVIMPAHRTERYVGEAIESVVAQSRTDWELIVVDDSSPDRLADRVVEYLDDPRITLHRLSRNVGASAARNVGATLARGAFLTMLDSDDRLEPDYLQLVAQEFERRPEVGLVGFPTNRLLADDGAPLAVAPDPKPPVPGDVPPDRMLLFLLRMPFVYHGATFRREVFDEIGGYDAAISIGEDLDIWTRTADTGHPVSIRPETPYLYRQSVDSALREAGKQRQVAERWMDLYDELDRRFTGSAQQRALAGRVRRIRWIVARMRTQDGLREHDWRAARRAAFAAARYRPTPRSFAVLVATLLPSRLLVRVLRWGSRAS